MCQLVSFFFFFNDTATTEIYTLSLHDALPISRNPEPDQRVQGIYGGEQGGPFGTPWLHPCLDRPQWRRQDHLLQSADQVPGAHLRHHPFQWRGHHAGRSEEHTAELQSPWNLVFR